MRGRIKPTKTITISGKSYLQHYNDDTDQVIGDVLLIPHIENRTNISLPEIYRETGSKGYYRAFIYDGRDWGVLNYIEIFPDKEHQFSKSEYPIDIARVCSEIIIKLSNTVIYRTYRNHYTTNKYIPNDFKGKKGHMKN